VQILVAVAIIQMRALKTEVEKGSMWTTIEHGLAGPKRKSRFAEVSFATIRKRDSG
jgi:hypothetical protein